MCDCGDCNQCCDARWEMEQYYKEQEAAAYRAAEEAYYIEVQCEESDHPYAGIDGNGNGVCHCGKLIHNGLTRAIERVKNKEKS